MCVRATSKEKLMGQINYKFKKLTPDIDADISVYDEAIEFVFDNSDVTNIAVSGAYGAGKSSVIGAYEKKHSDKKFMHISLAHFEPANEQKEDNSVEETVIEGKILNQLIHQIPADRIPQTNFRVKKDVAKKNIISITVLFCLLIGSITFISLASKIQEFVEGLTDNILKVLLSCITNNYVVFLASVVIIIFVSLCV